MNSFEQNTSIDLEKELPEGGPAFELLKTPEIVVQEERGLQLLSLVLKAQKPERGESDTPLAKEVMDYFKNNPIDADIAQTIEEFYEEGVDEETLFNLALTYHHPERAENIFELAEKYKPHVHNPQEKHQKLLAVLEKFDTEFSSSPLALKLAAELRRDADMRLERIEETRERIEIIINFFKPDSKTTPVKKVTFVPDPLLSPTSGRNFSAFPGEQIILSHIDNTLNQDHEFSHGIINPIVEKLSQQLTEGEKERISELASLKLKQDYGEGHFSLLCEEFIRTYVEVFSKGKAPQTYEDFVRKISDISEADFQKSLTESGSFKIRCDTLGIHSIDELREKSQEYFEKFEKNPLRDLVFELYQDYQNRPDGESQNFEAFVLTKFQTKL